MRTLYEEKTGLNFRSGHRFGSFKRWNSKKHCLDSNRSKSSRYPQFEFEESTSSTSHSFIHSFAMTRTLTLLLLLLLGLTSVLSQDAPVCDFNCKNDSVCTECVGEPMLGDVELCRFEADGKGRHCGCEPGWSGLRWVIARQNSIVDCWLLIALRSTWDVRLL